MFCFDTLPLFARGLEICCAAEESAVSPSKILLSKTVACRGFCKVQPEAFTLLLHPLKINLGGCGL